MRILFLLLTLALGAPRKAPTQADQDLATAGLLVRDGDRDRARELLDGIDPTTKGLDVARYWTLRGLVHLQDGDVAAVEDFRRALAVAVEGRELLEMHLARAHLLAKQPAEAVAALDRAGEVAANLPGSWLLRAEAESQRGSYDAAWAALEAGAARFPDQAELRRQQVFLLVNLGLYREARERGEDLLARPEADADDAVAIAEALRRGGETAEAATILEAALLEQGEDRDLLVEAARAAIDDGQPRNAGRFLERAAVLDPALALEAAEAYRRAGEIDRALLVNGQVVDPVAKARQRLGLLLEGGQWERAVALEERLIRLGLSGDDGVAYGLGYAWFRMGDFTRAERWLQRITDPAAFQRATALREAMAACETTGACS